MKIPGKLLRAGLMCLFSVTAAAPVLVGQSSTLVVVDPLYAGDNPGQSYVQNKKTLVLPDQGNPLRIITNELKTSSYDEVHIYVLTKPGSLIFDETAILSDNIRNFAADFSEWKGLLIPGAKIIIHSENLLSGPGGDILTGAIAGFTGYDVNVVK